MITPTIFSLPVRVYYEDTDAGGIVYYANYFKYAERSRTELLRSICNGRRSELENGIAFVVREAQATYIKPARLDDLLHVTCDICSVKGTRVFMKQEVRLDQSDILCASLDITVCTVRLDTMKPCKIPDDIYTAMNALRRL